LPAGANWAGYALFAGRAGELLASERQTVNGKRKA